MEDKISIAVKLLQTLREIFSYRTALLTGMVTYGILYIPKLINLDLGYEQLILPYRSYLSLGGAVFLLFGSMYPISVLQEYLKKKAAIRRRFSGLTMKERLLLGYCVRNDERTVVMAVDDPVIMSLTAKGIFSRQGTFRAGQFGSELFFPFSINEIFWKALIKKKSLILAPEQWESEEFSKFCEAMDRKQAGQSRMIDI